MKIIGHRGARGLAPENTLASFDIALEHKVDEIELDVRVTKDHRTALIHDAQLVDIAGNHLVVAQTTFAELAKHKPGLVDLPTALKHIKRKVPVIIEVKPLVATELVIEIVKAFLEHGWKPGDFRFASYDQDVLLALHAALPEVQTIVIENWSSVRARRRMKQLGTNQVSMLDYWLWGFFIRAVSRGGWELNSFPPKKNRWWAKLFLGEGTNNPAKARKWAKYGLAGVITDYPDRFKR
ncbi:MAG TPA: glycerophosphodiester phosphodiesterase [Candidatus Saccharimonadales bacterium]|nr:glycerophosphodiester phosphodiesterase [Candidatus Saccharimonadales bacterium]